MGKIMKNGRSYTYTSAPTTTRFVSDPNNENYGWIQYKDENGEWVNWEQVETIGTIGTYLYNDGVINTDIANLVSSYVAVTGDNPTGTTTFNANCITLTGKGDGGSSRQQIVVTDRVVNLKDYKKIVVELDDFDFETGFSGVTGLAFIGLSVSTSNNAVTWSQVDGLKISSSKGNRVELDVSSISSSMYITVRLTASPDYGTLTTNVRKIYLQPYEKTDIYPLYMSSANEGGFETYAGSTESNYALAGRPTVEFGESLTISWATKGFACGSVISRKIDLTDIKEIRLTHVSRGNGNSSSYVKLFVTPTKQTTAQMVATASVFLLAKSTTKNSGDVVLDVSSINGEFYIGIEVALNTTDPDTTVTTISNFYLY